MRLHVCLRCGKEWCYRGTGVPRRCGQCGSPYWDKERRNAEVHVATEGSTKGGPGDTPVQEADAEENHVHAVGEFEGPPDFSQDVCPECKRDGGLHHKRCRRMTRGDVESLVQKAYEKAGIRPHDTKGCLIYKCGMCASLNQGE